MNKTPLLELIVLVFVFFVGGGMTGLVGLLTDGALMAAGLSQLQVVFLSNFLLGLVVCALYWHIRSRSAENRQMITIRLDRIGLMKHFVGKALRAMSPHVEAIGDSEQKAAIVREVRRIEWALCEVLPCGWEINEEPSIVSRKKAEPIRKPQVITIIATERTIS